MASGGFQEANGDTESILKDLEILLERVEHINDERNYWLIRTDSGKYYDSFVEHNYVALGHNRISLADINRIEKSTKNDLSKIKEELKSLVSKKYKEDEIPGLKTNQIFRFIYELKEGDIVLIPSDSSEYITLGEVTSDDIERNIDPITLIKTNCNFTKRKSVNWIKTIRKTDLDIYLYKALHAHQAINNISHYSEFIERALGNFYILDGEANLILDVQTRSEIDAITLFGLGYNLLYLSNDFFNKYDLDFELSGIDVKINLNSPGKIQLKDLNYKKLLLVGLLVVGINGGGFTVEDMGLELKTDGLIKNITEFLDNKHNREMQTKIMDNLDSLKVAPPNDIIELINSFESNSDSKKLSN